MSKYSPLKFQEAAIDDLTVTFKKLWSNDTERQLPLLFKSPTGSGKTFMMAHFVHQLALQPDWSADVAFIWITFSDDLAMQSRDKFRVYFQNTLKNNLLTVQDVQQGILKHNDILFLNWQKVVKNDAATRRLKLRRPKAGEVRKEAGYYFEDVLEATHAENREIVVIMDESHKNTSTVLSQDILNQIDPKVILKVTATPEEEPKISDVKHNRAGFVEVERTDVIAEGLIKEKIIVQTEEDLKTYRDEDLDKAMLRLAFDKRLLLKQRYEALGKPDINPLVLIQLPNDDADLKERGEKTKEEIVLAYLVTELGVAETEIAQWFDQKKVNLDYIADNDNPVSFMLFKQAAGTGWDCPRASVLVMFREVKAPIFHAQVLGRILRTAEPHRQDDYRESPELRSGYLYTNYERNKVELPDGKGGKNKPYTLLTTVRDELRESVRAFNALDIQSDYLVRIDYGDLADAARFQRSFADSMNRWFCIDANDADGEFRQKLHIKGVDTSARVTYQLIVDAEYTDFDNIRSEILKQGRDDTTHELSPNDLDRTFNFLCWQLLKEQDDEDAKYSNIARAWATLKSALNVWLRRALMSKYAYYQVFACDIQQEANSAFRPAITQALKDYRPVLKQILDKRQKKEEAKSVVPFRIRLDEPYTFTDDYEAISQRLGVLEHTYVLKTYSGRKNEEAFIQFLEGNASTIDWWFKNGVGQEYYGMKYTTPGGTEAMFYPDWIIKLKSGRMGIFDTKNGQTLKTEGRAGALARKVAELGTNFFGGIVRPQGGIFEYCLDETYDDIVPENLSTGHGRRISVLGPLAAW